jgi:hypothetical protein
MAGDFSTGLFCYNTTSQSCGVLTQNSNKPFPLANAGVIFNRTSGSVGPNATVVGVAAATTVLAGKGGSSGASTGKEVGLGVGLRISLGVLLLIALGLLWRSIKQRKNLEPLFTFAGFFPGFLVLEAYEVTSLGCSYPCYLDLGLMCPFSALLI